MTDNNGVSPAGCSVFPCDDKGNQLRGSTIGGEKDNLKCFFARAGLLGTFGLYFRGKEQEGGNLIGLLVGEGVIRVSQPKTETPLIAVRKGESRRFLTYKMFFPEGMPEEEARKLLAAAAADTSRHFGRLEYSLKGAEPDEPLVPRETPVGSGSSATALSPAVASETIPVSEGHDETPTRATLDERIERLPGEDFLVAAKAFVDNVESRLYGMKLLSAELVSVRRRLEFAYRRDETSQPAAQSIRLAIEEHLEPAMSATDDFLSRLLPAAERIGAVLDRISRR